MEEVRPCDLESFNIHESKNTGLSMYNRKLTLCRDARPHSAIPRNAGLAGEKQGLTNSLSG